MSGTRFGCVFLALFVPQLCSAAAKDSHEAEKYELVIIDVPGAQFASFTDINDRGEAVGVTWTGTHNLETFYWTSRTGVQILTKTSGSPESMRPHINSKADVATARWTSSGVRSFRWNERDGFLDLGTLGGNSYSTAINKQGDVVGYSNAAGNFHHAFRWTKANGMKDLGTLGGWISEATDINDHGHVTGTSETKEGRSHAFLWTERTGMKDLGVVPGYPYSFGLGINNRGDIYGTLWTYSGLPPALFHWAEASGLTVLRPLGGYWSIAHALNDRGEIVGETKDDPQYAKAFVWTLEKGVRRLPTLGGNYSTAMAINNHGAIVGYSSDSAGAGHSVLWTIENNDWKVHDLGTKCFASFITDSGLVAGYIDSPFRQIPCLLIPSAGTGK